MKGPTPWQPLLRRALRRGLPDEPDTAFSCVADSHSRFRDQCALWVSTLLDHQGVSPERVFVHLVEPADQAFAEWLAALGIRVVSVAPFDDRSPHCNKLRQLETAALAHTAEQIMLMDCDTVWLGDRPLPRVNRAAAKLVDNPTNPPRQVLERLFAEAELGEPEWVEGDLAPIGEDGRFTDCNNCNGGVYLFARRTFRQFAEAWPRWARWCLDRRQLFGRSIHFDQVSYALAARELRIRTERLGVEWNYPAHLPSKRLPDLQPQIIHYHRRYTADLALLSMGLEQFDVTIMRFNSAMAGRVKAYRAAFPVE